MSLDIDIDDLGIEELEALNERIVARLKFLDTLRAQQTMMQLNLGAQVSFDSARYGRVVGTVIKFNQKTVVVLTEDRRQWRVPPHILSPIKDATPTQAAVRRNNITSK